MVVHGVDGRDILSVDVMMGRAVTITCVDPVVVEKVFQAQKEMEQRVQDELKYGNHSGTVDNPGFWLDFWESKTRQQIELVRLLLEVIEPQVKEHMMRQYCENWGYDLEEYKEIMKNPLGGILDLCDEDDDTF